MKRRQHYVAVGLQRFFALDGWIVLYDKKLRSRRDVGIRDAFVERSYNSFFDQDGAEREDLEELWAEIETSTLPIVRRLDARKPLVELEVMAVKQLAAMHLARSQSVRKIYVIHLLVIIGCPAGGL